MQSEKTVRTLLAGGAVLLAIAVIVVSRLGGWSNEDENQRNGESKNANRNHLAGANGTTINRMAEADEAKKAKSALKSGASEETTSTEATFDSAPLQPRAFLETDFSKNNLPSGFKLTNVVAGPDGLTLGPQKEPGAPTRRGVIESPPMPLGFTSNAMVPMWKEKQPDGTSLMAEMSVSPDGQNWTGWRWMMADEDSEISQTYPDGRPNPNYGYIPAGMFAWGPNRWQYARFRVTLTSANASNPAFSAFRLFYMDSTLGTAQDATLADVQQNAGDGTAQSQNSNSAGNSQGGSQNAAPNAGGGASPAN